MNRKILIVDDSEIFLEMFRGFLQGEGYIVETAADGIEAIAALHEFKPDTLIVDLIMPKLQGDKLCRLIRTREDLKHLFIIVLSAIAAEKTINVSEFGGDVCIAKGPFQKMKPIVLDLLARREKDPTFVLHDQVLGLEGVYRREITSELLAGRHHADVILNNISDGIVELTDEGRILFTNPRASLFLGEREEMLLTSEFSSWFADPAAGLLRKQIAEMSGAMRDEPVDISITLKDRIIDLNMVFLNDEYGDRIIVLMRDVTGYMTAENNLKAALRDKDILIKEVHHRVKNNLAMVASLVALEMDNVVCRDDVKILQDLRSRIGSIGLVHDKLYRSSDMTHLNLRDFLVDLVENILNMSSEVDDVIRVEHDIPDLQVMVDAAIPLAIIVSELVTNSLKYAFTDPGETTMLNDPAISVRFNRVSENECLLEVRDNGKGFGEGFAGSGGDTLGMRLVESLATQLDGTVVFSNDGGAMVRITLPWNDLIVTS